MAIDLAVMAQFLTLPGASELIDAYARIPPGPLRENLISQAQLLAGYDWRALPAQHAPLLIAGADMGAKTVELRLQGKLEHDIAAELALPLRGVIATLKAARKDGVVFPGDAPKAPPPKAAKPKRQSPTMTPEVRAKIIEATRRKTAERWGITYERYVEMMDEWVRRAKAGESLQTIAAAYGQEPGLKWPITPTTVGGQLSNRRKQDPAIPYFRSPTAA